MSGNSPEAVRLVIWDLDDTFWKGTITEGGITEYLQAHHDIVVTLASRGIVSSICSKNAERPTLDFLASKGIHDYFVMPSISWEPKGARLAALIDAMQLRPATVMFIDDNPNNRAEAEAFVPGLQIEAETFVSRMLDDPRFRGKDDSRLTRLAQYKLLETRKQDEQRASGDNSAFLRGCDIRVFIENDVVAHLDRAIELIQRTNQLNFTKQRLSENPDQARTKLKEQLSNSRSIAGLVRVVDKYGDYGFVGFFLIRSNPPLAGSLHHFCFSCRTLGMGIERFVYDHLNRPQIEVFGEVLTDLSAPLSIDWIRLAGGGSDLADGERTSVGKFRIHGGCESGAIAHYLRPHAEAVEISSSFASGGWFVALNAVSLLMSASERAGSAFRAEAATMDLPYDLLTCDFFDNGYKDAIFVFCGGLDAGRAHRYRHKSKGWELRIDPVGIPAINLFAGSEADLLVRIDSTIPSAEARAHVRAVAQHIRAEYEVAPGLSDDALRELNRQMLELLPMGARFVFVVDSTRGRDRGGILKTMPNRMRYRAVISEVIELFPFATMVSFDDAIYDDGEIQVGGNHSDRMVYLRLAENILEKVRHLPGKATHPLAKTSSILEILPG